MFTRPTGGPRAAIGSGLCAIAAQCFGALLALQIPPRFGTLVATLDGTKGSLNTPVIAQIAGLYAGQLLLALAGNYFGSLAAAVISRLLRERLFSRISTMPLTQLRRLTAGSISTRVTNDVQQIQTLTFLGLTTVAANTLLLVVGISRTVTNDPSIGYAALVTSLAVAYLVAAITRRAQPLAAQLAKSLDGLGNTIRMGVAASPELAALGALPWHEDTFDEENQQTATYFRRSARLSASLLPVVVTPFNLLSALLLLALVGESTPQAVGRITTGLGFISLAVSGAVGLAFTAGTLPRGLASRGRVREASTEQPTPVESYQTMVPPTDDVAIRTENVNLMRQGALRAALTDVTLDVKVGQLTVLTSKTGQGSSILLEILAGVERPTSGCVSWLDNSSRLYLAQESQILDGSLRSNLTIARSDSSDTELLAALRSAGADSLAKTADELSASLTNATTLSGGERRRIALARLILSPAKVALIDEPFVGLDLSLKKQIVDQVLKPTVERTTVVCSVDPVVLRKAETIVVISEGVVIDVGAGEAVRRTNKFVVDLLRLSEDQL